MDWILPFFAGVLVGVGSQVLHVWLRRKIGEKPGWPYE